MALTQMQLIQSLGEAMNWLERELNWGVPPTELRHLCGRIGELYVAVITNGQMANEVNQHGYDVIGNDGLRISVKTTARKNGHSHVTLNPNTLDQVDRLIALKINTEDMQVEIEVDAPIEDVKANLTNKSQVLLSALLKNTKPSHPIKTEKVVRFEDFTVKEYENGSFEVIRAGEILNPAKPYLMEICKKMGIPYLREDGRKFHTRVLGTRLVKELSEIDKS